MQTRCGDWAQTASGRAFYPFDPRPEDIHIEDIAAGLSRQCRYAGQLRDDVEHYSVAEHSVCLARYFYARREIDLARWALMHDAAEAYISDIIRPVKRSIPAYFTIEAGIMLAVCRRYGLDPQEPDQVKDADGRIIHDERLVVMAPPPQPWRANEPLGAIILCYSARMARSAFMHWFGVLFPKGAL